MYLFKIFAHEVELQFLRSQIRWDWKDSQQARKYKIKIKFSIRGGNPKLLRVSKVYQIESRPPKC